MLAWVRGLLFVSSTVYRIFRSNGNNNMGVVDAPAYERSIYGEHQ
jgi:hypothetical protein